ncbi:MAG: MerR family transcriptional regulator [Candidatus Omnitrophota bacterium]
MKQKHRDPVYTIGIAAKLLKVCSATLRIWEKKGLIKPTRLGKNRFYSQYDIEQLEYIKMLLQEKRLNIEGVREILKSSKKCWKIKKCKMEERKACPVYLEYGNA